MSSCKKAALQFLLILVFVFDITVLAVSAISRREISTASSHKDSQNGLQKVNPELSTQIKIHGFLLWFSMAFLMPTGLLVIRMSNRVKSGKMLKFLFYSHVILQTVSVVVATGGAILALKNFENTFNTIHQRIGLALYALIWIQPLIAIFRPNKGDQGRSIWYYAHWFIGIVASVMAMADVYLGLHMYKVKTSKNTRIWTILFTAQVSIVAFIYLLQDRWDYMQKQGIKLPNEQIIPADQLPSPSVKITKKKAQAIPC